jgi:hypothetical protein
LWAHAKEDNVKRVGNLVTCREVVELLSDYVSEPVGWRVRIVIRAHLKGCPGCSAYEAQLVEIIRACQKLAPESPSETQMDRLLAAYYGVATDKN